MAAARGASAAEQTLDEDVELGGGRVDEAASDLGRQPGQRRAGLGDAIELVSGGNPSMNA